MKRTYQKWLGITAALAVVLALAVSLTSTAFYYSGYVNSFLGLTGGQSIEVSGNTNYYPSAYGELNAENSEPLSTVMVLKTCENFSPNSSLSDCMAFRTESASLPGIRMAI